MFVTTSTRQTWHVLCSRVIEKSSLYGMACIREALDNTDRAGVESVIHFSDGPKQFKSTTSLGMWGGKFLLDFGLHSVCPNFLGPRHGKSICDTLFGVLAHLFENEVKHRPLVSISEVVSLYAAWGDKQHELHPEGPRYIFKDGLFLENQ